MRWRGHEGGGRKRGSQRWKEILCTCERLNVILRAYTSNAV